MNMTKQIFNNCWNDIYFKQR